MPMLALAESRTWMLVLLIVPAAPTVMLLEKPEVGDVETSKPSGALTVMPSLMFVPETVKLVVLDGLPTTPFKADKVPVTLISAGGTGGMTENPTMPLELIVIVPSYMLLRGVTGFPSASTPLMVPAGATVARIRCRSSANSTLFTSPNLPRLPVVPT